MIDVATVIGTVPCPECKRPAGHRCITLDTHQPTDLVHRARVRQAEAAADLWACEDCGWQWPLKDAPYQNAECDACGGTMRKLRPAKT